MNFGHKKRSHHCSWVAAVLFGMAAVLLPGIAASAAEEPSAVSGPLIRSASEIAYPPFCFVDAAGQANGFSVELLRAALAAMGRSVTFRVGPWAEVKTWLEHGEVQALPLVGRTPERESIFDFTFPYMTLHGAIVVREDTTDIRDLRDLKGRHVAVMKGDYAEELLRREDRGIDIRTTTTFKEALLSLSQGRYDAVVIQRLLALRLIQEMGIKNLKVVNRPVGDFRQDFCFAVKEGDRDTLALLNEGLALVMADGTYRNLHAKWFAALELPARRIVVGGDSNYPPYEYLNKKGGPAGFNVALTRAVAREVGLDIEIRLGPWEETIQALEKGEIDVIQGMLYSPERDLNFDFSQPYLVNNYVAVVREGEGAPPASLDDLKGKRIVVQKGDIMNDFALKNGLGNRTSVVGDQEDALRELAKGKYDCALVSRLTAFYCIKKNGWHNLVAGRRPLLSPEYCYAVQNGHRALLSSFSEGLKVLEDNGEYRKIHDQWLGVYKEEPLTLIGALRYSAIVVVPLFLLLLAFFLWSWSLRRQVARHTAELRESEELMRAMIECSPVALYSIDPDGRVLIWNASAERIFGWTAAEAIGKPLPIVPEDKQEELAELRRLVKTGKSLTGVEVLRRRKDGSSLHGLLSVAPVYDTGGRMISIMGAMEDITERKKSEQALQESERRYRRLIDAAGVARLGVAVVQDRDDIEAACVFSNAEAERLTGHPKQILEKISWFDLVAPGDREAAKSRYRRRLAGETLSTAVEISLFSGDGTEIPVEVNVTPTQFESGEALVVFFRDIRDRRQAEAEQEKLRGQLAQAQKMESVGRLAGGVAHDYNNMLGVIIGYSELALTKLDRNDPVHSDLREILSAAKRSADITRQLLAFARKQTIAPRVLDLNETVSGMLNMLRRLIGEDIDLAWQPGSSLWPVKMDPTQIDQVLANLCINARDAIAGVGKVTIETANVALDEAYCAQHAGFAPGEFALLAVSDDGCGMDKETLHHIFEPFFTTKEKGRGTGLGLATIYGIVKQNNGFINVYSEPDKGTTFRIYLPRHAGEAERIQANAAEEIGLSRGETVLLVEDEPSMMKMGQRMLEILGYRVLTANKPSDALRLAREHANAIHLLITDVVMPEMSARDLANQLKSLHPDLKVLFMSGYTADTIAHRGVLDEGVEFIQKPFSMQDLAAKVRIVLEKPS